MAFIFPIDLGGGLHAPARTNSSLSSLSITRRGKKISQHTKSSHKKKCCGIKADKDASYKNYPWEKVEKFIKEELKLDLFNKTLYICRYVDKETKIPTWEISWQVYDKVHTIEINANTGEIVSRKIGTVEK